MLTFLLLLTVLDVFLRYAFLVFVPGVFGLIKLLLSLTLLFAIVGAWEYRAMPGVGKWIMSLICALVYIGIAVFITLTPVVVGTLGIIALVVLIALRVPVGISLIIAAVLGSSLLTSRGLALGSLGASIVRIAQNYDLGVVPFIILTGAVLVMPQFTWPPENGQKSSRHSELDPGLPKLCTSHNVLAPVLAPVLGLIVFAFLSGESIGRGLMAGVYPVVLVTILLIIFVPIAKMRRQPAPPARDLPQPAPPTDSSRRAPGDVLIRFARACRLNMFPIVIVPLFFGGIFTGVFTPTQAGAVCAIAAVLYSLISGKLDMKGMIGALVDAGRNSAMVFVMIIGGSLFGVFLTRSLIHLTLIQALSGSGLAPFLIVISFLIIYMVMSLVANKAATFIILTPIAGPVVVALGYSGLSFGVLSILAVLCGGLARPALVRGSAVGRRPAHGQEPEGQEPMGLETASLETAGLEPETTPSTVRRQQGSGPRTPKTNWPVLTAIVIAGLIIAAIPNITTLLPRMMYGL